jgi:hypothetical protein
MITHGQCGSHQPELIYDGTLTVDATAERALSDLLTYLYAHPYWCTAKSISAVLGLCDRTLRDCAQHSDGQIISGQKGYKHHLHATPEETHHAAAWLESQAKTMATRAAAIRRRAHQSIHDPTP